ncbi:nSTAND3 domain-containing NTPase [Streptomyces lasiicapitis]|uniref:nSTAND3 domain-containing NTPase n=1 Tax=Streptomyces lasiicapitis TaxID=1923961 RepID=UPI0036523114
MSKEVPAETHRADTAEPSLPSPDDPKDATSAKDKETKGKDNTPEPSATGEERDGPISESDALRSLSGGSGHDAAERAEALRAGAIADLIAQRLNADASGTRIGTLALFNDAVSFGGGFHTDGGRTRTSGPRVGSSALPLDPAELADYTKLFVQPEGYDEALETLREQGLLVLTGPPGSGRAATAVNLLAEAMALDGTADDVCHRLLVPSAVLEAGWEPPVKGCGYLAELDDGPAAADRFAAVRQLTAVAAALRNARCHLVLTGGHDLAVVTAGPGGEAVARQSLAPVDPLAVVELRVLGHDGADDAHTDLRTLLESTGAARALAEQPTARHAVHLASVIRAGGDVAAAVTALRDPSDQVRAWFGRHHEPDTIAFALAAAVLEGSGYLTVSDAALRLRAALAEPSAAPPDVRFRDRLGHEQQWILLDAPKAEAADFGPPRVRFRTALLGQVILAYAWSTLDGRRDAILDWLRRLLSHSDLEVRARASVAAGVLAWADHHYAVHRFLKSWASSTSWPLRQAAATALGVAGSRPESAEPVWELLHGWARGGSSAYERRLAGTAANAAGGLLGCNSPERAVAVLRDALDRGDDWGTLPAVAWGGVHLMHQGQTGALLDAFLDWSKPQDLSPMVMKSLSAFVFAVSRPYEQPADGAAPHWCTGVPGVPLLLSSLPRHGGQIAELWARALARRPVQDSALEALREWIDDHADACPGALDEICGLLHNIAHRGGKHRERLLWWLSKWASDRERPSANAAKLRRRLERAS